LKTSKGQSKQKIGRWKKKEEKWQVLGIVRICCRVNLSKNQAIIIQNDIWPCLFILKHQWNSIAPSLSLKNKISFKNTLNKDHQHVEIQFRIRDLSKSRKKKGRGHIKSSRIRNKKKEKFKKRKYVSSVQIRMTRK